jgi:hypothetical protein
MKVTELRIGNWVQFKHTETPVRVTLGDFVMAREYKDERLDDYEPIPLTEEWLERFEYELIVFDITKGDIGFDFWLVPKWSDYSVSVNLEHVHQLQNLYFALTQEEIKCS